MTDDEYIEYAEEENNNGHKKIEKNGKKVEEAYNKFKKAV